MTSENKQSEQPQIVYLSGKTCDTAEALLHDIFAGHADPSEKAREFLTALEDDLAGTEADFRHYARSGIASIGTNVLHSIASAHVNEGAEKFGQAENAIKNSLTLAL